MFKNIFNNDSTSQKFLTKIKNLTVNELKNNDKNKNLLNFENIIVFKNVDVEIDKINNDIEQLQLKLKNKKVNLKNLFNKELNTLYIKFVTNLNNNVNSTLKQQSSKKYIIKILKNEILINN